MVKCQSKDYLHFLILFIYYVNDYIVDLKLIEIITSIKISVVFEYDRGDQTIIRISAIYYLFNEFESSNRISCKHIYAMYL